MVPPTLEEIIKYLMSFNNQTDLRLNCMNFDTFVILGRIENLIWLKKEFKKKNAQTIKNQ
jgi:hypothetical protein